MSRGVIRFLTHSANTQKYSTKSLVAAGEASGTLDESTEARRNQKEKDAAMLSKVRVGDDLPSDRAVCDYRGDAFSCFTVVPQVENSTKT